MSSTHLAYEVYSSIWAAFVVTAPFLIAAIVIGFVLGLIQAVTQIQDQTLPQLVKILVLSLMLVVTGGWLSSPLVDHSRRLFTNFPVWVR
ncbi:MAG TPA: flagellar biosynthetic protein FliQ [Beijerinckiaceae bacterium]|nr:flagellar biosynthetic protein FliQ [Beijerinckiaceae bacterium]